MRSEQLHRRWWPARRALMTLTALVCGACAPPCLNAHVAYHGHSRIMRPGDYRIVMRAVHGPKKGTSVEGLLRLRRASPYDRSPKTGLGPCLRRERPGNPALVGSLDIDYEALQIGATILVDPSSRDPVHPGVMYRAGELSVGGAHRRDTAVLTMHNRPGFLLLPYHVHDKGFSGAYYGFTLHHGVYCATFLRPPPPRKKVKVAPPLPHPWCKP